MILLSALAAAPLLSSVAHAGGVIPEPYPNAFGKATATFSVKGPSEDSSLLTGYVTVTPFQVETKIDVDFDTFDWGDFGKACAENGLKYHIHQKWSDSEDSAYGSSCGAGATGGHLDPTFGCGGASGNPFCGKTDLTDEKCVAGSTGAGLTTYTCSQDSYAENPFGCEISDYSSKFGVIVPNDGAAVSFDQWGAPPALLDGLSIVLHCTTAGAPRVACAKLVGSDEGTARYPQSFPDTRSTAYATFSDGEVDIGAVQFTQSHENNALQINIDVSGLSDVDFPESCGEGGLKYHIHEKWENEGDVAYGGEACGAGNTGGHWDPTIACSGATGNALCQGKGGCVPSSYAEDPVENNYVCSADKYKENPYVCEVSDLSGKFGLLGLTDGRAVAYLEDPLMPPVANLVGKSIVFHCNGGSRIFCGKIMEGDSPRPTAACSSYRTAEACDSDDRCEAKTKKNMLRRCVRRKKKRCSNYGRDMEACRADPGCYPKKKGKGTKCKALKTRK